MRWPGRTHEAGERGRVGPRAVPLAVEESAREHHRGQTRARHTQQRVDHCARGLIACACTHSIRFDFLMNSTSRTHDKTRALGHAGHLSTTWASTLDSESQYEHSQSSKNAKQRGSAGVGHTWVGHWRHGTAVEAEERELEHQGAHCRQLSGKFCEFTRL